MKRRIIEETRKVIEEEDTPDSSSPGEGVLMFIFVLLVVIGLHSMMKSNRADSPKILIDQRGNAGTINNDFDDFGNGR